MTTIRTIRFCRTPISFTDLPDNIRAIAEHDKDLLTYMGEQLWSFMELLHQCKGHSELRNPNALSHALICFIEIGLIRTEESVFLEEAVHRLERALDESGTMHDAEWAGSQMAIKVGGAGHTWAVNAIAFGLGNLLRGMTNCIETTYTSPENGEPFLVTVTKKRGGKTPMDLRRELLDQIKVLVEGGGATAEQLQAILDANATPPNPVGLAADAESEKKYPWVRWHGDHFTCLRCLTKEHIEFPSAKREEAHADFAARHDRCMPNEPATGDVIMTILNTSGKDEVEGG